MFYAVDDADSQDAYADMLESYDAYVARMADDLGTDADDWDGNDPDPADPSPAAAALPVPTRCRECAGSGTRRYHLGGFLANHIEETCLRCAGTGAALPACTCCRGTGMSPHPDFAGKSCWMCQGSGADPDELPAAA